MKVLVCASVAAVLGGCVGGAGPYLGYGQHGWVVGGEAFFGGQLVLPQGVVGYQYNDGTHLVYARVDEAIDLVVEQASDSVDGAAVVPGGRVGGGVGALFDQAGRVTTAGVFAAGLDIGRALQVPSGGVGCNNTARAGVIELQVRYAHGWSVGVSPRLEWGQITCFGD